MDRCTPCRAVWVDKLTFPELRFLPPYWEPGKVLLWRGREQPSLGLCEARLDVECEEDGKEKHPGGWLSLFTDEKTEAQLKTTTTTTTLVHFVTQRLWQNPVKYTHMQTFLPTCILFISLYAHTGVCVYAYIMPTCDNRLAMSGPCPHSGHCSHRQFGTATAQVPADPWTHHLSRGSTRPLGGSLSALFSSSSSPTKIFLSLPSLTPSETEVDCEVTLKDFPYVNCSRPRSGAEVEAHHL